MSLQSLVDLDPEQRRCPYHTYGQLREEGVQFAPELDAYVVSRHDDVVSVLRNHKVFSSKASLGRPPRDPNDDGPNDSPLLILSDQPSHATFRSIVNRAFTPARVRAWESQIRELCDGLIDDFVDEERVDFVASFSGPLPIAVITSVLGVPREDAPMFRRYSEELTRSLGGHRGDPEGPARVAREFASRIDPMIVDALGVPSQNILPVIAEARANGVLTAEESTRFVMELLVAGNITTSHHLTSSMLQLARDPRLASELRDDPSQIPSFIEESLRLESPIQGLYRTALEDVEVGGASIPAGSRVFVLYGAANRDPRMWDEAAHLDLAREQAQRHLAFGRGIHTCLGAPLARVEGRIAVEQLLERLPPFVLDAEVESMEWLASFVNHGPLQLPLKFGEHETCPGGSVC